MQIDKEKLLKWLNKPQKNVLVEKVFDRIRSEIESGTFDIKEDSKQFSIRLIDERLVIDMDNHDALNFKASGYTGLPERFELDELCLAPVIGRVEISDEQYAKIKAEYENGGECAWCGEVATELRAPHIYDRDPNGGKMCRNCWEHDREVYKGSYGEDIGPFRPIKEEQSHE